MMHLFVMLLFWWLQNLFTYCIFLVLLKSLVSFFAQGLTKTGDDYAVKAAHVELAERMRKVWISLQHM